MTPVWLYAVTFVAALLTSLVLVPVVRDLAHRRDIVDRPGGHKSHRSPVPYLGGVAMFAAFSVAALVGAYVLNYVTLDETGVKILWFGFLTDSSSTFRELLVILGLGLLLSAMGLIDDLRGLSPLLRFLVEVAVATVVVFNGIHVVTPMPDGTVAFGALRAIKPWTEWICGWGFDVDAGEPDSSPEVWCSRPFSPTRSSASSASARRSAWGEPR